MGSRIKRDKIKEMVSLREAGLDYPQIANYLKINRDSVAAILNGRRQSDVTGIPFRGGKEYFNRIPPRQCLHCKRPLPRGRYCATHYWQLQKKGHITNESH